MLKQPKILVFAGSTRTDSCNKKLAKIASDAARSAGAEVIYIDLKDFPLPIYDGDLEEIKGLPAKAKELKKLFMKSDGFIIASPEYNSSVSGVLKNTIDWISRPEKSDPHPLCAFRNKVAAIMSASPSNLGGLRGLITLRSILSNIFVLVLAPQVTVAGAYDAFDDKDELIDKSLNNRVVSLSNELVHTVAKLSQSKS